MTRVSTSMVGQSALQDLQRAQQALFKASAQSSSQVKADDMKGYGRDAQTLVSANRMKATLESRMKIGEELGTRFSIQASVLEQASDTISGLKQKLSEAMSVSNGGTVSLDLEQTFNTLKSILNTNISGNYIFNGTMSDQKPVTVDSLSDLAALPAASDAFTQGAQPQIVNIDGTQTVETGPLAIDGATEIFEILQRLEQFNQSANGPFSSDMTDQQKDAIKAELANLDTAYGNMISLEAENGRVQKLVETTALRQQKQVDALEASIGDVRDVDLAEVAVRLNQAQISYQASASVFSVLRGLTLLDAI